MPGLAEELNGLLGCVALVGIDTNDEFLSKFLPKFYEPFDVFGEIFSKLHLQYFETALTIFFRLFQSIGHILDTEGIRRRHRLDLLTQVLHQRTIQEFCERVVKGDINRSTSGRFPGKLLVGFKDQLVDLADVATKKIREIFFLQRCYRRLQWFFGNILAWTSGAYPCCSILECDLYKSIDHFIDGLERNGVWFRVDQVGLPRCYLLDLHFFFFDFLINFSNTGTSASTPSSNGRITGMPSCFL